MVMAAPVANVDEPGGERVGLGVPAQVALEPLGPLLPEEVVQALLVDAEPLQELGQTLREVALNHLCRL